MCEWLLDQVYCISLCPGTSLWFSTIDAVEDAEPLESKWFRISTHFFIAHDDIVTAVLNLILHKLSYVFANFSSAVDGGYFLCLRFEDDRRLWGLPYTSGFSIFTPFALYIV